METTQQQLTKDRQALLLILSMDEDVVAPVLRHLDPEEIRVLHSLAAQPFDASSEVLVKTYEDFLMASNQPILVPGESKAYIERLAQRSLGREESKNILSIKKDKASSFGGIEKRSAESVAQVLADESPQVIAAVLAELSPAFASSVLTYFDAAVMSQIMFCIATLDEMPGSTIEALCRAVDEQLEDMEPDEVVSVDGMGKASSILQRLGADDTEDLLTSLGDEDPALAMKLRRAMFSFEDLVNVQGRGMQVLIKEISNDQLLLALKTASDELKDKIMASVSKRAAEIILDDLMAMGPARLSEVEQAQQEIVDAALRLEAENKLVIAGRGGEELV